MNHIIEAIIIVLVIVVAVALGMHRWHERLDMYADRRLNQREYWEARERVERDEYLATIKAKSIADAMADFGKALEGSPLARQPTLQDAIDRFS